MKVVFIGGRRCLPGKTWVFGCFPQKRRQSGGEKPDRLADLPPHGRADRLAADIARTFQSREAPLHGSCGHVQGGRERRFHRAGSGHQPGAEFDQHTDGASREAFVMDGVQGNRLGVKARRSRRGPAGARIFRPLGRPLSIQGPLRSGGLRLQRRPVGRRSGSQLGPDLRTTCGDGGRKASVTTRRGCVFCA